MLPLKAFNDWLEQRDFDAILFIGDTNTLRIAEAAGIIQAEKANYVIIPADESAKNFTELERILATAHECGLSRKSLIVNVGGGKVSDIGGFAAAVYMRGIQYVNIPTSLIGMVDAAIGGKTAINFSGVKNLVGSFHFPSEVFIDTQFLKSLTTAELMSGEAEILKYCFIIDEPAGKHIFHSLQKGDYNEVVKLCIESKLKIVDADPKEAGPRMLLNFGHTIGHALEAAFLDSSRALTHGHAVALGMEAESRVAARHFNVALSPFFEEILAHIADRYAPVSLSADRVQEVMALIYADKKNHHGIIKMMLPGAQGKFQPAAVPPALIQKVISELWLNL